jgi:transcriptional regulator with XRE-family HTH domain
LRRLDLITEAVLAHIEPAISGVLARGVVRGRKNPLHYGFSLRLARARKAAGLTGSALSLTVGMARNAASHLEGRARVPRVDTVEKLAKVLHISPCQLAFGVEQSCDAGAGLLSAGLPARLIQLRQERGLSRLELGQRSDTSHTFVRMTESGATVPSIAKVEQLAKALQVSVCWLAFGLGSTELPARRRPRSDAPPAPAPIT